MSVTDAFKHSTPELYDRFMGPLFFEPYARFVAKRSAQFRPNRILETAAGTGIVTDALHRGVPEAEILATDINPAMLDYASKRICSDRVTFQRADAQDLPFGDGSFDLVVCQFGVMFFPDKVRAAAEALRVLRQGGRYLFVTFDGLERNPVPKAAGEAVASMFSKHPRYMERGPFSYSDPARIEDDLSAAGFTAIEIETVQLTTAVVAEDAAQGIVLGSPFRAEIEQLGSEALERSFAAVAEALSVWDGKDAPMSAYLVAATS